MPLLNSSGVIGQLVNGAVENVTGDIVMALALIFLVLVALAFMLGIPVELVMIFMVPFLISASAYYFGFFGAVLTILAIIFSWWIARGWLMK